MVPAAFTLAAVAKRVGVTEAAMRRWEMGTSRPRARNLRALARELGVSVEQLGFRDAPAPESPNGDGEP